MENDLISLLYISESPESDILDIFSKDAGFITECRSFDTLETIGSEWFSGDILLVDPVRCKTPISLTQKEIQKIIQKLAHIARPCETAIFLVVDTYPEASERQDFWAWGITEILVAPFSAAEVRHRAGLYVDKKQLTQQAALDEEALEKSFQYLDRFKKEVKTVKEALIREKNSLNNALKQIHHLSRERRHLKKNLLESSRRLDQDREGFEKIMTALIQERVEQNRGHGLRVAKIADFLGRQFGFDEKKLEDLRKAAMLHEIGLLFLSGGPSGGPAENPGETAQTYDASIKILYPVKGADLLAHCNGFEACADIIRYVNEHADGTGSPKGLKRKSIPIASRILAGADILDTLKDEMPQGEPGKIVERLERLSGSRLDPLIVAGLEKYVVVNQEASLYKVRGVGISQLAPGMRLGTGLFTSGGTKLFSMDTVLTREAIDKIIQYNKEYPVDEIVYIKV